MSLKWWQTALFYQIYPRSFADGNGDGIGDFQGITEKLDYLKDLGVDAIWLSPHYPSPFLDCGYDISDYSDVGPEYGTLGDFKIFINQAHQRGIRVILDLVLNHSSDQHPWFVESRISRTNPKRDWYIWRDGQKDGPPNNWVSIFGGSAWELEPQTGQYYYHAFLKEQPDLNWRNPEVKQAMWKMMRFWLDMGVDGFRLDAIGTIFEHPDLPNHTLSLPLDQLVDVNALSRGQYHQLMAFQTQQPGLHDLMKELRALLDEYPGDRMLVGEDEQIAFYGSGDDELHLVYNFPLMRAERLTPTHIRTNQKMRLSALPPGAWPCNTLGNHDTPRMWSRYGYGAHNAELARLNAALMLTLKGTVFLYNGEEIGMTDLKLTELSELRDTAATSRYQRLIEKGGLSPEEALLIALNSTRDRCRSPYQWSHESNAGFSPANVQTWLPVHPNYAEGINAQDQQTDPNSYLNFYKRLIRVRKDTPALIEGEYHPLHERARSYFAFLRITPTQTILIVLNYSNKPLLLTFDLPDKQTARPLFSTTPRPKDDPLTHLPLAPYEVLIAELL